MVNVFYVILCEWGTLGVCLNVYFTCSKVEPKEIIYVTAILQRQKLSLNMQKANV